MFPKIHSIDLRGLNPDRYMEFVRVFVQTDLNRPLPPGSYCTTDGVRDWLGFRYEKLYILCYYCGRQGHVKQVCQKKKEDLEAGTAAPPEGRFTPWMKAGTRAERPPPPPRGRVIQQSPGDAGSSSESPGFVQHQIWVSGRDSPMTGSISLGLPATPSEGSRGMEIRGPPGFTPHPFPTGISSLSPRMSPGIDEQRLQNLTHGQNLIIYGSIPRCPSPNHPLSTRNPLPLVRNLTSEMEEAGKWNSGPHYHNGSQSGPSQAQMEQGRTSAQQAHLFSQANSGQGLVSQMMMDLNRKMDLNLKPNDFEYTDYVKQMEEGQAEFKKRKHGQPLDFEGPYFSPEEGPSKPRNARIRVKGRKVQHTQEKEDYGDDEEGYQGKTSEAPVAGYKPPGGK
ncbi:unnamed protein product [Linum trigynum]|uniref:CCHC-type domain-containing protein n=1 Tax=Linum trigynum TaxID=586398 RepID=A0AAV2CMJ2_9ROSI